MSARGRVLSVGNNSDPVLASLRNEPRPEHVLFVVSTGEGGSKSTLEYKILPELPPGYSPHYHLLEISEPDNIEETFRETQGRIREWMSAHRLRTVDVNVDFTGGTKVMSVVLGLAVVEEGVDTAYVSGDREDGTVITGTEKIVILRNPYKMFAVRELIEGEELLNTFHADAASRILLGGSKNCAAIHRDTLKAYYSLASSLAQADLFEFNDKGSGHLRGALQEFRTSRSRIRDLLSASLYEQLEALFAHWERVAYDTSTRNRFKTPGRATLLELLANADRRELQGRFDDAVGRLYRAVELRGQQLLKEAFGGELGNVPVRSLNDREKKVFANNSEVRACRQGPNYELRGVRTLHKGLTLCSSEDITEKAERYGRVLKHMRIRNQSLLAHGLSPVSEEQFNDFWNSALEALDVDDPEIPRWPKFELPLE